MSHHLKNDLSVAKFGGTSMGDAAAMRKSAALVQRDSKVAVVVVSAISGTTNELIRIFETLWEKRTAPAVKELAHRHLQIARNLGANPSETHPMEELFQEMESFHLRLDAWEHPPRKKAALDYFLSFGERLSSHLFVMALRGQGIAAQFFDVRQVMRTDDTFGKAEPDLPAIFRRTQEVLVPLIEVNQKAGDSRRPSVQVTQGFIGATEDGHTTTLGRGGSDYSAALLAEALGAHEVQIWTDVPGIMTMDPNQVQAARIIPELSFSEAAELANFGAKVLHPATIWPAARRNIRTFVGSTFQPEKGGTWIYPNSLSLSDAPGTVKAIALRKNQTLMTVTSLRMLNAHGFLAKLFGVLASYRVSVDLVTTSEVSVALTFDQNSVGSSGEKIAEQTSLLRELREFCDVVIEENLTLVAMVGSGLSETPRLSSRTFNSIAPFNIRMICQGASPHNLCFLVKSEVALDVVNRLHQEFIGRNHE